MSEPRSPRVLLIEDDFVQAGLLRRWLESDGLNVRHANSGDAAWKLMTDGSQWDLVISDLNLPDRSGLDLLMGFQPRRRGVPFLLLTAYQEFESAVQALRYGAEEYLVKPVTRDVLMAKVRDCLSRPAPAKARKTALAVGTSLAEVLQGCGGTLVDHASRGDRVVVVIVRWSAVHPPCPDAALRDQRATHLLGAELRCLNLEAAPGQESAVRDAMDGLVSTVRPDTVYAPTTHDEAGEVRTLHAAVRDSARSATRVFAYQALRPTVGFSPSTFVDVTRHLDDKLELLARCAQDATGAVDADVARATATYWGRFGPADQAEPLEVLRMAD